MSSIVIRPISSVKEIDPHLFEVECIIEQSGAKKDVLSLRNAQLIDPVKRTETDVTFVVSEPSKSNELFLYSSEQQMMQSLNASRSYNLISVSAPLFSLKKGTKKVMICVDESGLGNGWALAHYLRSQNHSLTVEFFSLEEHMNRSVTDSFKTQKRNAFIIRSIEEEKAIEDYFSNQSIGTHLFLSGSWTFVRRLQKISTECGFMNEEISTVLTSPPRLSVYCAKCQHIGEVMDKTDVVCEQCGLSLEVSTRYSNRFDAYLGYIKGGKRVEEYAN